MASINKQSISGDLEVGRNMATGGNLSVTGKAEFGGRVTVKGFLDAPNLKVPCKGVFETDTALRNAYPKPQSGWFAYVEALETNEGEAKPEGSTDTNKLYWVLRAYNGKWEESGYGSLNVTTDVESLVDSIDGENGINVRLGEVESTVETLSSQVGGSSDGTDLTSKVSTLQTQVQALQTQVKALDDSETQSTLKHYTENVEGLEFTTENYTDTTDTNAVLALNKNTKNGRVKVAAESVFIETSDFEIEKDAEGKNTGRIIRKDGSTGGSIYLTTPDGITQRATRIILNALERVDQTDNGATNNGKIELFTTFDKDITHNNSRVLTERDIFNGDLDEIPTTDADGEAQEKWALDARLAKEIVNGAYGGTVRFDGIQNLERSGVQLIEGKMEDDDNGDFVGVLWLEDKQIFVGVKAKVVVDCGKEYIVHEYYTDWSTADYYMEEKGVAGGLWKEKVYIHAGSVWIWQECLAQLVKGGGAIDNPLTKEDIDRLFKDFEFVDMGQVLHKAIAKGEGFMELEATTVDDIIKIKGKTNIKGVTKEDVIAMFDMVDQEEVEAPTKE